MIDRDRQVELRQLPLLLSRLLSVKRQSRIWSRATFQLQAMGATVKSNDRDPAACPREQQQARRLVASTFVGRRHQVRAAVPCWLVSIPVGERFKSQPIGGAVSSLNLASGCDVDRIT